MNDTIYSTNLVQTFLGPIIEIAFFFLMGAAGILKMRSENKPRLDLPFAAAITLLHLVGAFHCVNDLFLRPHQPNERSQAN